MLINCTNHPYSIWSPKQKIAAEQFEKVVDIPFPPVDPECSAEELSSITDEYATKIESMNPEAVLVAGEYSLTFMLVDRLLRDGQNVLCSRAKRITTEVQKDDGTNEKVAVFDFQCFYPYGYYTKTLNKVNKES